MSTSKADSTDSYIFGDDDVELKRLKDQDKDVNEYTVDVISRLGIKPGSRVLDLACGPGFVSINHLSKLVGENGKVVALDMMEKWTKRIDSLKIANITTACSKVQDANFEENEFDAIFVRYGLWVLDDLVSSLVKLKKWLKPGGRLGIISVVFAPTLNYPAIPASDKIVEAFSKSVELSGGNPWTGVQLPRLLAEAGLSITYERAFINHGGPASSVFQYMTGNATLKACAGLVEKGLLSQDAVDAYIGGVEEMKKNPYSRMFGFINVEFVAEK